jgi:exodeoxyribonuclease VII small subunit
MAKPVPNPQQPTFETALERLEQIVGEMEGDRLALEDLLGRYEEGTALVKVCQQRLDAAERRIEQITRGGDGTVKLESFDPATQSAPQAAPTPRATPAKKSPQPSNLEDVSLF